MTQMRIASFDSFIETLEKETNNPRSTVETIPVWVRPTVPGKYQGRKGTRKGWKRKNRPRWMHVSVRSPTTWEGELILREGKFPIPPVQFTFVEKISNEAHDLNQKWLQGLHHL